MGGRRAPPFAETDSLCIAGHTPPWHACAASKQRVTRSSYLNSSQLLLAQPFWPCRLRFSMSLVLRKCFGCATVAVPAGGGVCRLAGLPHLLLNVCAAVQWLFLLEGAPAVLLGFLICWRLAPDPEHAAFLKPAELQWLLDRSAHCTPACTGLPSPVSPLHLNTCTVSARHQAGMAPEETVDISRAWNAGLR